MTLFSRALFHAGDAYLDFTTSIESGVQKLITGPKPIILNCRLKGTSTEFCETNQEKVK